ncbi:MAG: NAD(P)/FAD-dependent oxidoreductase [Planctomycetota bacterium]
MDRRAFLQLCALLGVAPSSLAFARVQDAAPQRSKPPKDDRLDVIVIGAGAAGLTAGFLLAKQDANFEVLEAAPIHGGRAKRHDGFGAFPFDLGGEWIHTTSTVLDELSQDNKAHDRAVPWTPMTAKTWNGGRLTTANMWARVWRGEHRFEDSTWFDFFNDYMVPPIGDRLKCNQPVVKLDWSGDHVIVQTKDKRELIADRALVTVPVKILQDGDITFVPPLPESKQRALNGVVMPGGLKMFIEFKEAFYPDMVVVIGGEPREGDSSVLYYNACLNKPGSSHVLGLFAHGNWATPYVSLDDDALLAKVLGELDEMFDGAATTNYVQHVTQDWTTSPFIRGTYSDFRQSRPKTLARTLDDKVYFAGEAYTRDGDWGYMHGAARAAYAAIKEMKL